MTACDVAAIAKPWEQQHELARQVADEFFDQGDMEKLRLNEQPIVSRKPTLPDSGGLNSLFHALREPPYIISASEGGGGHGKAEAV